MIYQIFKVINQYRLKLTGDINIRKYSKNILKKLFKNSEFKKLVQEFNLELTPKFYALLYRIILQQSFEDAHLLQGSLVLNNETNQELGAKLYYNSEMEVKAYTNQIIEEINTKFYQYQVSLLKGESNLQEVM